MGTEGDHHCRGHEADLGFTLVELLIVVAVLGVLAAAVIFALSGVTTQSAAAACSSDASVVQTAVQAYDVQTGGSPVATPALLTAPPNTYLHTFPTNPRYQISISPLGVVMIAAPSSATAVPFGTANACSGAG